MAFKSLDRILGTLQEQNRWQDVPLHRISKCWSEAVGTVVASHTRPLSIQRDVLWVATSSAVWAQELTFGRQQLLTKLNTYLPTPLADIRFSTAQWQRPKAKGLDTSNQPPADFWQEHPSLVTELEPEATPTLKRGDFVNVPRFPKATEISTGHNPKTAFQHWAKFMQARSQGLPLCPQCHCPTPVGELQRWDVCAICISKNRQR